MTTAPANQAAPDSQAEPKPAPKPLLKTDAEFFADERSLSPAMKQFATFKRQHPDCVLFFRMGDFYELFGDDARKVGEALGLTVTTRGNDLPMAGVPHHQLDPYLRKAIEAGFRVAVCDQVQDPSEAKGVVARAVSRVVTPGTLTDSGMLADEDTSAVAAIDEIPDDPSEPVFISIVDLSTGSFTVVPTDATNAADELLRRGVTEVLYPAADLLDAPPWVRDLAEHTELPTSSRPAWHFRPADADEALREHYKTQSLAGFGFAEGHAAIPAMGAVVRYLRETQATDAQIAAGSGADTGHIKLRRATLAHLAPPRIEDASGYCVIDAATLRSLEIERTVRGSEIDGSLLGVFLRSPQAPRTAMGKRLLRAWLGRPLCVREQIQSRLAGVSTLVENRRAADELADALSGVQDVARISARLALGRASPRDLVALGSSLGRLGPVLEPIAGSPAFDGVEGRLKAVQAELAPLAERVAESCVDDPPSHLREGGLLRDGVDAELDEARSLQRDAGDWLAEYQTRMIDEHDLSGIKVGFNRVFGYYIELTSVQAKSAPASFTRKQTLKNAERFITPELKEFEDKVLTAESRAVDRERALFDDLCAAAVEKIPSVAAFAEAVAELDVLRCFADKAVARGWTRPELTDDRAVRIAEGRHPVLDELLESQFVPNGADLGALADRAEPTLALITGPNMAGKSTYIRQVALLTVLAQAGSFVPAQSATLGVFDRVFTRVGADDALHRGQSTFMVEMIETANILNHATNNSLVVLDEIGRGTSTLDGLSLAWAIAERLAGENGATPLALFATHYHELTDLESQLTGRVGNLHVQVKEWKDPKGDGSTEIVFTHRIARGRAEASYGVHVARLAGVPKDVTDRANQVLQSLAVHHAQPTPPAATQQPAQMGLFTEYLPHPAIDALREIDIESITPMQAFDELRKLKETLSGDQSPT